MKKNIFFGFVLCLTLVGILFSQEEQQVPLLDLQNVKYPQSFEKFYKTRSITQTLVTQVLEAELEAENYIVGPGDQFKISVFGEIEEEIDVIVLPEGTVLLPGAGELKVSGGTLLDVKDQIKNAIARNYIKAEVRVNLRGLRKFRVYLTGEVENPGTYFAQGSDRLSDVLEVSAGEEIPAGAEGEAPSTGTGLNDWADDTAIEIHSINGKKNVVDISLFYRFGDKESNPYLRGGDIIFAPSIDLTESYVIIEGNVGFQGIYPLKKDENLFEFLRRVSALSKRSNLEGIILERAGERIDVDLLNEQEKYRSFPLQNKDKIIIPLLFDRVYVRGEVFNPGALPYLANYRAKDYIGQAGALDTGVGVNDIIVIRQRTGEILKGGDVIIEKGDTIVLPKRGREVFKDYMTIVAPIISLLIATVALVQR